MVYADELVRVSHKWQGETTAFWPGELAVNTYHLHHHHDPANPFSWDTEIAALPGQLHAKWVTHWGDLSGAHSNQARVTQIKCAHIAPDGTTLHEGALDITDDSLRGSADSNCLPPEVALCVSSWAYPPGGFATHKGRKRSRFYLPYLSAALLDTDGTVVFATLADLVDGYQSLINDIQGMHTSETIDVLEGPDYWDWAITSKIDATWRNADFVSIDKKFDAQRRRQHQSTFAREVRTLSHS